jgi:hypothetical protein
MEKAGKPRVEFLRARDGREEIFVYGSDGGRDFVVTYRLVRPRRPLRQHGEYKLLTLGGDHVVSIVKSVDEALQLVLELFSHGNINLRLVRVYTSEGAGGGV